MKEIYKKGTKVMGWRNSGVSVDEYYDKPFVGEVLFYKHYDNVYECQISNKISPIDVNKDNVILFIQEIYDEGVKLYNEAQKHYEKFHECKSNMRKLLSS